MIFAVSHDFTNEEFAEVGKLLWAFSLLEDELARAAMKLRSDVACESGLTIDDQVRKIVKADFKGRFSCFVSALKAADYTKAQTAWIDEAELKFKDGNLWRNRICHGKWKRLDHGKIGFRLYDRDSVPNEIEPQIIPLGIADIQKLTETTLQWVVEIATKAGTTA